MSILKQLIGVAVVLLLAGGGFFAYEQFASGRDAEGDGAQQGPPPVPVELARAKIETAERRVEAVGSTMARRAIEIVPLASGRISELAFETGDTVAAGDPLVFLDDDIEKANHTEAQAALRRAELALERARTLRESNTVTQATLEDLVSQEAATRAGLERAERRLADRVVRAPFDGVVGLKRVDEGARVSESTVITTLDDRSEMEIEFSLPETLYGRVQPGQAVEATSVAFPGQTFEGTVATIDSRIDQTARAFKVRARLPNPDLVLPAGMFVHLSLVLDSAEVVMIPEEAVVAQGNRTYVYVSDGERAERRDVRLGERKVGAVEIAEGLSDGEQVVVQGTHRLRDGAAIRIISETPDDGDEGVPTAEAGPV